MNFLKEITYTLHPSSVENPGLKKLNQVLINWVNVTLKSKMIVRNLVEDLADGEILAELLKQLRPQAIPKLIEGTTEKAKLVNLEHIVRFCEQVGVVDEHSNLVEGIWMKDFSSIYILLVAMCRKFRGPALPSNVMITAIKHEKYERTGDATKTIATKVTSDEPESTDKLSEVTGEVGPDEFDEVYGSDEKRPELIKKLLTFASAELSWMHDGAPDLDVARKCSDFDDGVNFILLVGTLGSFFVPMNQYNYRPNNDTHKLHNVQFAISLLRDLGADTSRIRAEDITRSDEESILRFLNSIITLLKATSSDLVIPQFDHNST